MIHAQAQSGMSITNAEMGKMHKAYFFKRCTLLKLPNNITFFEEKYTTDFHDLFRWYLY